MKNRIPRYSPCKGIGITEDINVAIMNGYIGEEIIYPRPLVNDICLALGLTPYLAGILYWFGTPNKALKERFNL